MFEKLSFFLCMCYVALSRYLLVRFLVVASLFCYCLFTTISLIVINTKKTLHSFRWAFQSHFQDCAKEFPSWDRHREKERERRELFSLAGSFPFFSFDVHWCIDCFLVCSGRQTHHHSNANGTETNRTKSLSRPHAVSCHRIYIRTNFLIGSNKA